MSGEPDRRAFVFAGVEDPGPPAAKLWRGVIRRAILDLYMCGAEAHAAWTWLFQENGEEFPGFAGVCALLGAEPDTIRRELEACGLGDEPPRYPPKPRTREAGVGRGAWTNPGHQPCPACGGRFWTIRRERARLCDPCRALRYGVPPRKRSAA